LFPPAGTPSTLAASALAALQGLATAAYAACQAALALYASHRWAMVLGRGHGPVPVPSPPREWPPVTVQLPVYNERAVVVRLIEAAGALDYPADRLEIQVLDDSSDGTSALAAAAVERLRARGLDAKHLRRAAREGYKAGALAAGLAVARGEFVAVFDADFVPARDFLRSMLPHFTGPGIGMVQARWGHLNRDRSALTAAQATLLDAHFLLEHSARARRGLFFNFNGTAGIWRRACIDAAGGWSHDTLTEDLDLSYRAQLAGWRFAFVPQVVVPAELPSDMEAFKSQQRRWVKGSIQTARKLLPELWRRPLPARVKLEAFLHLTSNVAYPLLLALGLLLLPVMLGTTTLPPALVWGLHAGVLALGVVPVAAFLGAARREAGGGAWAITRDVAAALALGAGLSANNARAVFEGLGPRVGNWERTPKTGEGVRAAPRQSAGPPRAQGGAESLLAAYFAALGIWAAAAGQARAVPFLALLAAGSGWVALGSRPGAPGGRASGRTSFPAGT
jgi:hypothetical protein